MIKYENVVKNPGSEVLGLKYIPSLEPVFSDKADHIPEIISDLVTVSPGNGNGQFSYSNGSVMKAVLKALGEDCKMIVEVGVSTAWTYANSSTFTLLENKPYPARYIGIDLNCDDQRKVFETYKNNVRLLAKDSGLAFADVEAEVLGMGEGGGIDLLHIDGDHSIFYFLQDWQFVKLVKKGGYILTHDTNNHPGPYYFFDAVDETKFEKVRHNWGDDCDCGLAVYKKLF